MASIISGDYIYNTDGSVKVIDITKESYGSITSPIRIEGVDYPITSLSGCFYACSKLTTAPQIPETVTDMSDCFYGCSSLTQAPEIPTSITNMDYCFYNCTALTGIMKVHNNPSTYKDIFASNASLEIVTIEPISVTSSVYNKWNTIITNYSEIIIDDYFDSSIIFNDGDYKYTSVIGEEDINSYRQIEDGDDAQAELEYEVASGDVITVGYHESGSTTDSTVTFTNNGTTQTNGPITFDGGFNFIANGYYISWLEYNAINVPYYEVLVEVIDKNKTNYSSLQSGFLINDRKYPLKVLDNCFKDCTRLIQAPTIPNSVISMQNCFENCTSLVRVPNLSSSVVYMNYCFHNCSSLTQVPNIPTGATNLTSCFEECSSLTQAPVISNTVIQMGGCFKSCTSIIKAPVIPNSVFNLTGCFEGCTSLVQASEIPAGTANITNCFKGCSKLAQAPIIPSSVTNANNCFGQCTALVGNVKIATTAINSNSNSFTGTILPIYLINGTPTRDATITANLQAIAAEYSDDNLHFEAEDTTITASAIVQRVRELDSEIAGESTNAFIKAIVETNNMLPRGWTNTLAINSLQMDGAAIAPTWQSTSENLQSVYKTWYNTKDYKEHSFTLSVTGEVRDENKQRIKLINVNDIVFTLARAPGVPFSAYHDKETNTDGIAVGMLASRGNFLEVDWNAQFNQDIYLDLDLDTTTLDSKSDVIGDLFFELDVDAGASVDTDATSGANMELFNAIRQLGWYDSVITE